MIFSHKCENLTELWRAWSGSLSGTASVSIHIRDFLSWPLVRELVRGLE